MEEGQPFLASTDKFFSYCKSYQIPDSYVFNMVKAFSLCPDEQVSLHSICLAGAYKSVDNLPRSVIAASRIRRGETPFLVAAIKRGLEVAGIFDSWIQAPLTGQREHVYLIEQNLGVLPWLTISVDRLRQGIDEDLLEFLAAGIQVSISRGI